MFRFSAYCALALLIASCNLFNSSKEKKEEPIARVYDKYLYVSDLTGVGKGAARPEDSVQAVRNYVDSWIRHNLLLRYAQDNLPEEEKRLNERLQDYKESLLIYAYEKELLGQKLDTTVSLEEVQRYYNEHRDNFTLKTGIVQAKYIMINRSARIKLDSARSWMKEANEFTQPKLLGFCREYAVRYSVDDSTWYNKDELAALLPVSKFNAENAQFSRSYIEVPDSVYGYLIKFSDYRIKGSDAPLDFVKEEITNIIVNQRKNAFISTIHKSIYDDALKDNEFEVYLEEK